MLEKLLRMESDKVTALLKRIARATRKKALQPVEGQTNEDFLKVVATRLEKGRNATIVEIKNELLSA